MKKLRRKIAGYLSGRPLTLLLYSLIRLIYATMRIRVEGNEVMPNLVREEQGFVGIFWHGRMLMIPFLYPGKCLHILISSHRDGEIMARVLECFGFRLVRGSSGKSGKGALLEMIHLLKQNRDLGIATDGPRGPAEVLKPGVAQLARLSGKPVVPIAFAASRCTRMKSWDRFAIPHPFSRGVFVVGEPLYYREGEEQEQFRQRAEAALHQVTARADGFFQP
jgi:lysophospholipid acyltransferase (LPLAT)-like uncharacterized protein